MTTTSKKLVKMGLPLILTLTAVGLSNTRLTQFGGNVSIVDASAPPNRSADATTVAPPAPAAASLCPPRQFASTTNHARNPGFETVGPNGSPTTWQSGDPIPPQSAARFWLMHTNSTGATVSSVLRPTTVPGAGGARMLHFRAGGAEGGIFQQIPSGPSKLMFSAWVFVRRGQVVLQPNNASQVPAAWSTKHNEWEQLRVCTDGTVPTGFFSIYNQNPAGGDFFVDRVEIRETP